MSNNTTKRKVILHIEELLRCQTNRGSMKDCFHLGPISLDVYEKEILVVLGPSGSGKTMLLRTIAGLESAKSGSLYLKDDLLFGRGQFVPPEKRRIGMVFQDHALFPHLTVKENILFGIQKLTQKEKDDRLKQFEELMGLGRYLNRYPHELSGGQQQRVALARTLAQKPNVILLDEPLSNIDADLRMNLAQELRNVLKATGSTVIWVTHDQSEALDLADRILVINDGKVEQVDTPQNLYNQPKTRFVADFVGHAVFIKGQLIDNHIMTEIGKINCLPCLTNTNKYEVMIRPDDVKAALADNGIAKVVKRQFFGSRQLYSLELPSGETVLTSQLPTVNWPIGTKVKIDIDIKGPVAFPVYQ